MKVGKVMVEGARACGPNDSLCAAARIMWEGDCGCVPVVDADRRVVGMLTDRDLCMAAYTQGRRLDEIRAGSVMSTRVHVCTADEDLGEVEERMRLERVRRLPVVDAERRLIGLLSLNDLACEALREGSRRRGEVTLAEVGLTLASICTHREAPVETAVPPSAKRAMVTAGA